METNVFVAGKSMKTFKDLWCFDVEGATTVGVVSGLTFR